ncbi:hypothetical protein MAR_022588 [Mya arenaria]|uniref:Uncharacterized protein n=1 Tax=Mya arenaria TaxID=6604 RepID=A0ABY7DPC8_MYAAR|nr:hypothetical protein MAR_022588 [Mya arenaria]
MFIKQLQRPSSDSDILFGWCHVFIEVELVICEESHHLDRNRSRTKMNQWYLSSVLCVQSSPEMVSHGEYSTQQNTVVYVTSDLDFQENTHKI